MKTIAVLILLAAVAPHGEIEETIREFDRRVAAEPARLDLRLRRGELLRSHGVPLRALADFDFVLLREPGHTEARFFKALALRDFGRPEAARRELDRHLAVRPDHPEALRLSAQLAAAAGDRARARADWQRLFAGEARVSPDDALAFAAAARASDAERGEEGERRALQALEIALGRLGPAIAVELEAARCEARLGRMDAFEARFARLTRGLAKKDWFARVRSSILADIEKETAR